MITPALSMRYNFITYSSLLDLYPLQERIYPVAVYEGNWLAVPHVLINLSLVEQIVGPKRMYWLRLGIVIDELLEDLTKDIVAASNRTSTSNQECTRNDTTNNDSESSNHDGRDINNFRNAEDNAMGEDDSRAEENVVHTLEGSNRVDVQKDCIEFDEKDINNCEQGDGIDVMEKNSNQIASKDDNNTNNNDEEMKQNKLEVIAVLSNEVARMIHDNSHDWVPLSAVSTSPLLIYSR